MLIDRAHPSGRFAGVERLTTPGGDPPPKVPPVPPDPKPDDPDDEDDEVPETPPTEPPPQPITDPLPSGSPEGPYVV